MKYRIELRSDFEERYWDCGKNAWSPDEVRHAESSSYEAGSAETALAIARDVADAPDAEYTAEKARDEFSSKGAGPINAENAERIAAYYNFRLGIFRKIREFVEGGAAGKVEFDVPWKMNHFDCYGGCPEDLPTTQREYRIVVEALDQ